MRTSHLPAPLSDPADVLRAVESIQETLHRVDPPHPSRGESASVPSPRSEPRESSVQAADDHAELARKPLDLGSEHTSSLVYRLQQWAEELDEREACLNAAIATHERRERAFRMWMQNRRLELEQEIAEYQVAQARAQQLARQLALGG